VTPVRLSCGCETTGGKLLTVCALHANYMRQHVEQARQVKPATDKELQRQLVVAIAPIVVSRLGDAVAYAGVAERIHDQVHEIMRRMD
jgi:hypothetical protein